MTNNDLLLSVMPYIYQQAYKHARSRNSLSRLSKVDYEDLAHDYAAHILRKLHTFDPAKSKLITWTCCVVRRLHQNNLRVEVETKHKRVNALFAGDVKNEKGSSHFNSYKCRKFDPVAEAIDRDQKKYLKTSLEYTPQRYSRFLYELFFGGKTQLQAAYAVGRSRNWLRKHCRKAIDSLATAVRPEAVG